jgi:hypothetical protein
MGQSVRVAVNLHMIVQACGGLVHQSRFIESACVGINVSVIPITSVQWH